MSLIIPANSLAGGGYAVDNSLRFDDGSSDYLTRTQASGNRKTWTFSGWIKLSAITTADEVIWSSNNPPYYSTLLFADHVLRYLDYFGGVTHELKTSQVFRDPSAWYHIVIAYDTTQATTSNRTKIYINGEQVTSFSVSTYPSLNYDSYVNASGYTFHVGTQTFDSPYYNGYMSDINFIDGQQLTPTDFGEFDADSGVWKPIAYSGTYGTNGFFLEFQDSGALGTDSSGNGNTFTVNNLTSIDQTTDTPTNNFATLNPLNSSSGTGFSDGNLTYTYASASWKSSLSTIGVSKGKWYMEVKYVSGLYGWFGVCSVEQANFFSSTYMSDATTNPTGIAYGVYAGLVQTNATTLFTSSGDSVGTIIGIALDLDNDYIYFSKGGVFVNSGDPTSGASGTGGFALPNKIALADYVFGASAYSGTVSSSNYGNAPYTITTGNADANGYGNFEYAVPGYLSLCTKNLSEVN